MITRSIRYCVLIAVVLWSSGVAVALAGDYFERDGVAIDGYDPVAFSLVHGTLYLNYSEAVRTRWLSDVPGYIQQANANWPAVMTLTKVHE